LFQPVATINIRMQSPRCPLPVMVDTTAPACLSPMARQLAIDQRPAATQATWSPIPSQRNAVSKHAVTAAAVVLHQRPRSRCGAVLAVAGLANGRVASVMRRFDQPRASSPGLAFRGVRVRTRSSTPGSWPGGGSSATTIACSPTVSLRTAVVSCRVDPCSARCTAQGGWCRAGRPEEVDQREDLRVWCGPAKHPRRPRRSSWPTVTHP
jgi:hypothetical protein